MELFGVLAASSQQHGAPSIDVRQLGRSTFGVISKDFRVSAGRRPVQEVFWEDFGGGFPGHTCDRNEFRAFLGRFAIERFDSEGCIREQLFENMCRSRRIRMAGGSEVLSLSFCKSLWGSSGRSLFFTSPCLSLSGRHRPTIFLKLFSADPFANLFGALRADSYFFTSP